MPYVQEHIVIHMLDLVQDGKKMEFLMQFIYEAGINFMSKCDRAQVKNTIDELHYEYRYENHKY